MLYEETKSLMKSYSTVEISTKNFSKDKGKLQIYLHEIRQIFPGLDLKFKYAYLASWSFVLKYMLCNS